MHTGSGCSQGGNGRKTEFPVPRSKYEILSTVRYLRGFLWHLEGTRIPRKGGTGVKATSSLSY
jgi:hypothetical protein